MSTSCVVHDLVYSTVSITGSSNVWPPIGRGGKTKSVSNMPVVLSDKPEDELKAMALDPGERRLQRPNNNAQEDSDSDYSMIGVGDDDEGDDFGMPNVLGQAEEECEFSD